MESMQKYIEVLSRRKFRITEYSSISCQKIGDGKRKFEAEIQTHQGAKGIATI
jgi:hypothetical protein